MGSGCGRRPKSYGILMSNREVMFFDTQLMSQNVTAFLMDQNRQFEDAVSGLTYAKESLDPARLRNHDLLTSLDVLTTGSYRRLPTAIKKLVVPPSPLTDDEVAKTLADMEDVIRFRLKMTEIIPPEMSRYRIADGRVYFFAPKLFEVSLCVRGAEKDDGWFFVNVEFLFTVGGDRTGMQEFPRKPAGLLKRHITDEADARLAFYLPLPAGPAPPPDIQLPPRPQLPDGVVDTPLVRVFNFLQMMSLSYQLEILWYQAERLRSLGWADYLTVSMMNNRRTLAVSYWIRKPPPNLPGRPPPPQRGNIPALGGTLTISIVSAQTGPNNKASRPPITRVLAELQGKAKLDSGRPSDEVEPLRFEVKWEPEKGALGVLVPDESSWLPRSDLLINSDDLDTESLIQKVIRRHTEAILKVLRDGLLNGPTRNIFSPEEIKLVTENGVCTLHARLCADEVVLVTIDPRTGRSNLRDTGDLAAAGRAPRLSIFSEVLNSGRASLAEVLVRLKFYTITDLAEQKANYLGLQSYRTRNFSREELQKLGPGIQSLLYIQLSRFADNYLVLVITEDDFRYALITAKVLPDTMFREMVMEDIAWLDVRRIHGDGVIVSQHDGIFKGIKAGQKRKRETSDDMGKTDVFEHHTPRFHLETNVLRELYAYCCARVAYMKVEMQFKLRGIPYTHISSSSGVTLPELSHLHSSLARSIPAFCVQSSDILSGAPAAEAAMPNIRVIPLNWWSEDQAQVVTCVKLKYVQQPVGKKASSSSVIRPSKRIIYDTTEAIVSFLSEDVDKCVDEFLEEWARVSKMVVIAREVAQMSREKNWADVRLLSFDLQTVEFAYAADYTIFITCTDQLSPIGGSYDFYFSRTASEDLQASAEDGQPRRNPHEDLEPYVRNLLRHGRLAPCLHRLVALLRDTLPIFAELEEIRMDAARKGQCVDIFPKAAGWSRILFGDFRHALDFRLITGGRVVVLDGSHSLFSTDGNGRTAMHSRSAGETGQHSPSKGSEQEQEGSLLLQPIPDFRLMVVDAVKGARSNGAVGQVVTIDIGVICDASAVRAVGRALYERIVQRLPQVSAV
ncbi:hypothetical protein AcW1_003726 [Taiwanofungus camphoratus]|nr:hypothetical protein AcW1_003726 [Antrodia cinnamomea]KAI0958267.1 hypothetical protein AcV7_004134 [Antrodia cinnamomea]